MYFDSPRYRRLVEAIRDDPEDALRWAISDLVESEADAEVDLARAEFIRLQVRRADLASADPERGRAEARERELLGRFEADWRRELPDRPGVLWGPYERGFVGSAVLGTARQLVDHGPALFDGTALARVAFRELRRPADLLVLADHPSLADVRDLDLAGLSRYWALADLLASPHLAALRGLRLARLGLTVAEVADLARADLPGLRDLDLSGNRLDDEALGELLREAAWLGRLRRLDLVGCRLDRCRRVRDLLACPRLAALEELSLADTEILPQHLEPLLDDAALPALRRLDLRNCRLELDAVQRLLAGPVARRVEVLLGGNPGGDLHAALAAAGRGPEGVIDLAGRPLGGATLAAALASPGLPPARRVCLAQAGLALDDLRNLLDAAVVRHVEDLDLSGNALGGPEAVALLVEADLPHLRRLALRGCAFAPADVLALRGDPRLGRLEDSTWTATRAGPSTAPPGGPTPWRCRAAPGSSPSWTATWAAGRPASWPSRTASCPPPRSSGCSPCRGCATWPGCASTATPCATSTSTASARPDLGRTSPGSTCPAASSTTRTGTRPRTRNAPRPCAGWSNRTPCRPWRNSAWTTCARSGGATRTTRRRAWRSWPACSRAGRAPRSGGSPWPTTPWPTPAAGSAGTGGAGSSPGPGSTG